jgi:DNA-binding transcriptional regulator YiaG
LEERRNTMAKHTSKGAQAPDKARRVLPEYDATTLVGLRIIVHGAAIEHTNEGGEISVEVPKVEELAAAAAVARCLAPVRLRGYEIKAMRKIMDLTLAELAKRLDPHTAPETISRWENEAQPMGGFAEKLLRLLVCEDLHHKAPGVAYNASMISHLNIIDPWRADPNYEPPTLHSGLIKLKEPSGSVIETWGEEKLAA